MSDVTLYNGDYLEVLKNIESNSVDFAFTSPPYNRERNNKDKALKFRGLYNFFAISAINTEVDGKQVPAVIYYLGI